MIKRILAGSILAMILIGCGGSGGSSGTCFVYGVNALPNIGAVSITANGTLVMSDAGFGSSSSTFVATNAGTQAPVFLTNSSSTQIASGTTNFTDGDYYTAYALGNTQNNFVVIYPTDVSAPTANTGKLIFVNASVLQPSVDIYITLTGATQGVASLTSITPFNSGQEIANLAPGTYDVQFKTAGTQNVLIDEPTVTIGTTASSNEIQIVGITDNVTASTPAQFALPIIPVPVVASASAPRNMGRPMVIKGGQILPTPAAHK
jgi:hypothetical protein